MPLLLCLCVANSVCAQEQGQVGVSAKAQLFPQAGLYWQIIDPLALRGGIFLIGGNNGGSPVDISDFFIASLAITWRWRMDDQLSIYTGPDFTYSDFVRDLFIGLVAGAQYQIYPRFGLYGELGVSLDVIDGVDTVQMFNTGIGIIVFFNGSPDKSH